MRLVSSQEWIDSLDVLGNRLRSRKIPDSIMNQALENNPWFTVNYIERALEGITQWLKADILKDFISNYEIVGPLHEKKRVGIIAAGNLPWVGIHDVFCGILSGHQLSLKLSHQDNVLMDWLIKEWKAIIPELNYYLNVDEALKNIDFLIATGSNNTARYFAANFKNTPKIIRKNRFSIGIIDAQTSDSEIESLCDDMLLYNGLGCRNVSNIILLDGQTLERLQKKLEKYPISKVNSNYLERILFESTRKGVITQEYITSKFGLFFFGTKPKPVEMGYFQILQMKNREEVKEVIKDLADQIQIVVGDTIPHGTSQNPKINDFADGVDTMKILTESWKK